MTQTVWITWENHRRSRELSRVFNAELLCFESGHPRPVRYVLLAMATVRALRTTRPKVIFCQNPSIVLAALLCVLKHRLRYKLIVDRHSNFKFETVRSKRIKWICFHFLSARTLRGADLTIVTNRYLKRFCDSVGANTCVLPDKLPDMRTEHPARRPAFMSTSADIHVMFVTAFDADEPIDTILQAAELMPHVQFYLTGNYTKVLSEQDAARLGRKNITLTGFISDDDYANLMSFCDVVSVLTKKEFILNCGAYEALAMNKPLVLSKTRILRSYFKTMAIYTELTPEALSESLYRAFQSRYLLKQEQETHVPFLQNAWASRLANIKSLISDFS